jgi:hypothetical protein
MENWGQTIRFCVIMFVMSICTLGAPILAAWIIADHGHSVEALYRSVAHFLQQHPCP